MENNEIINDQATSGLALTSLMMSLIGPVVTAIIFIFLHMALAPGLAPNSEGWGDLGLIPIFIFVFIGLLIGNFFLGIFAFIFGIKARKNKMGVIGICIGSLDILIPLAFALWILISSIKK
jgi:hypothetical protein